MSERFNVAGMILLGIAAICFIGHLMTYFEDAEDAFADIEETDPKEMSRRVIVALLQRAQQLRSEARQFIVLIFLLAISGGTLFNFSGQYSYAGLSAGKGIYDVYSLQSERKETQKAIQDVFEKAMKEAAFADDNSVKTAMLQAAGASASEIAKLGKSEPQSHELEITMHRNMLISSIIARMGIVAVLAYLIKILLGSYRYNLRLANYFSSRAYSVALIAPDALPKELSKIAEVLGPESVDFEKLSDAGVLDAAKIIKSVFTGPTA